MKNISEINSDDILKELNNLDYDDTDDLKLLDDEDIKPVETKKEEVVDLYSNYGYKRETNTTPKLDMYTEQPKVAPNPLEKYIKEAEIRNSSNQTVSNKPIDKYLDQMNQTKNTPSYHEKEVVRPKVEELKQKTVERPTTTTSPVETQNNITDLNQLFNKVSSNVKGVSDIVNKNAEIKRKIEEKYNDLKKLQMEHEENKKRDYAEINAYRDEVYAKIQEKKVEFEKDYNFMRQEHAKLDNEKKSFEEYKNASMANLNKLEKELKDSYDTRNKNIEQVELGLVKRKEQLDIERANLAKEKEQIKKEKEELAQNLLQFNKLVSEFTNGVESF